MDMKRLITKYWEDVAEQNADRLKTYFMPTARVMWHNTNECFSVDEFITANCEYPGSWRGEVERIETAGDTVITAARVWSSEDGASFHAVSFFEFENGRIKLLNEYWGDDGSAPQWRLDKKIGIPIRS